MTSIEARPRTGRAVLALCSAATLMTAAMAVGSAAGTLVVAEGAGQGWAGAPSTAGIVGTGVGALVLPRVIARLGRRRALAASYAIALAGALVGAAAAAAASPAGVVAGLLLFGAGNAAAQLTRYLAGDLFPPGRRGSAIALVVFGSTVGAVGGPLLLASSGALARAVGTPAAAGPFVLCAFLVAAGLPGLPAVPPGGRRAPAPMPLRDLLADRAVRPAVAAMVTGQVVMVAVMTAAPVELHDHGAGLSVVGVVLSAHTAGMFVLSPLTGWLIDRRGPHAVMLAGLCTAAGACAFATGVGDTGALPHGLVYFGLGVAWNLAFVGGSTAVSRGAEEERRLAMEGAVDAVVWASAAVASAASPVLLTVGGLPLLGAVAAALAVGASVVVFAAPAAGVRLPAAG